MRRLVSISMPLLALTTIASREMCGARRSAFARIVWEGTTTMTTAAVATAAARSSVTLQLVGEPHVGEALGMVAGSLQHRRLVRSTRPQRRRHAVTRQEHGEGQAPCAGADDAACPDKGAVAILRIQLLSNEQARPVLPGTSHGERLRQGRCTQQAARSRYITLPLGPHCPDRSMSTRRLPSSLSRRSRGAPLPRRCDRERRSLRPGMRPAPHR